VAVSKDGLQYRFVIPGTRSKGISVKPLAWVEGRTAELLLLPQPSCILGIGLTFVSIRREGCLFGHWTPTYSTDFGNA
jgi:hypothetical protein